MIRLARVLVLSVLVALAVCIDAASDLRMNAAARFLGLRLRHGRDIDVPLKTVVPFLRRIAR